MDKWQGSGVVSGSWLRQVRTAALQSCALQILGMVRMSVFGSQDLIPHMLCLVREAWLLGSLQYHVNEGTD